jgi:hypothetical protein
VSPPISYGLLVISLGGIFAAGGSIGYFMGKDSRPAAAADPAAGWIGSASGASPETWADQAFESLAGDLKLSADQRQKVRPYLNSASGRVFVERDRALLQMHLRLLEVHNSLAKETSLDPAQKKRLMGSRAKLKAFILSRFAVLLKNESVSLPDL